MNSMDVAQRYFNPWNSRDPSAIVAAFAAGGTYSDPATGGPLNGQAIAEYSGGLFASFPDLSFDLLSSAPAGDEMVAVQWLMKGTNTGSFAGLPPSGQSVVLPGADFIVVDGDKVRSTQRYFDQQTLVEQLGLQAIVLPNAIGPFTFGVSVRASTGKRTKPGAFSLTWIEVRTDEEAKEVQDRARQITQDMMGMPGFISSANMSQGRRLITTSAWEDAEAPKQLLRSEAHKEAMNRFFGPDFAIGAMTSVWVPDRINAIWMRCTACGQMADYEHGHGKCRCGQELPDHAPWW